MSQKVNEPLLNNTQLQQVKGLISTAIEKAETNLATTLSDFQVEMRGMIEKSVKDATSSVDAESVEIMSDPAVWGGSKAEGGLSRFKWLDKNGTARLIDVDEPPRVISTFSGEPNAKPVVTGAEAKHKWLQKYRPVQAAGGRSLESIQTSGENDGQHEADWQTAKETQFEVQAGHKWTSSKDGTQGLSGTSQFAEKPGIDLGQKDDGGAMIGSTEVKVGGVDSRG